MIVPEDGAGMRKWRVTMRRFSVLKMVFWLTCIVFVAGVISMGGVVVLLGKLHYARQLNTQLMEAVDKLDVIAERLNTYEVKERKLRAVIGSDLSLPKPFNPDVVTTTDDAGAVQVSGAEYELDEASARLELQSRKVPTFWPVEAWQMTKEYSNTGDPRKDHSGIDLIAPQKSSVAAAGDGRVTSSETDPELGLVVVINHENGWESWYGHLETVLAIPGDYVKKGQQIAVFGGSGSASTGAHLHFAVYYNGSPRNPLDILEKKPLVISKR